MTEYVYKLKNGKIVSVYADEKGNMTITKEALEIMANSWNDGYQQGAIDMEKAKQIIIDSLLQQIGKIRAEVIEECIDILNDSFPMTPNADITCGFYCAIERLEQLKESE